MLSWLNKKRWGVVFCPTSSQQSKVKMFLERRIRMIEAVVSRPTSTHKSTSANILQDTNKNARSCGVPQVPKNQSANRILDRDKNPTRGLWSPVPQVPKSQRVQLFFEIQIELLETMVSCQTSSQQSNIL